MARDRLRGDVVAVKTEHLNENPEVLIDWFDNFGGAHPYDFLSNFHEGHPIKWHGLTFPTTEHAFAWEKVDPDHPDAQDWLNSIQYARDPGEAKALGRSCPLDPLWEVRKFDVMHRIVTQKFRQHDDLRERLLATGSAYLQEGTYWQDAVWGVILQSSTDPWQREGQNWLGLILMDVRHRLAVAS